jgi:hypothetical protein
VLKAVPARLGRSGLVHKYYAPAKEGALQAWSSGCVIFFSLLLLMLIHRQRLQQNNVEPAASNVGKTSGKFRGLRYQATQRYGSNAAKKAVGHNSRGRHACYGRFQNWWGRQCLEMPGVRTEWGW